MNYSEIIYEDNHLIAVNKKGGVLVQGDKTKDAPLPVDVKAYIKEKYNKPGEVFLGVVHRIDRPVSGLVLFARTSKATTRLNQAFKDNKIDKTYWAIVTNKPPKKEDHLKQFLLKDSNKNKSFVTTDQKKAKFSELTYKWIASTKEGHLLEVKPISGRHHQIRVMLSHIGCPIVGDLKYGAPKSNTDGNIALHALSIELIHPVQKEKIKLQAKLPQTDYWKAFEGFL
ncbi:MAG: RluA family pseudouridine synthase [Chitinophagales bacterium]